MSRANELLKIRELLQRRRREILSASEGAHRELAALKAQERDPEYEENAQAELADYTLSSLMEGQRREIMLIDAALRRMDTGVFGECVDCGTRSPSSAWRRCPSPSAARRTPPSTSTRRAGDTSPRRPCSPR